MNPTPNTQLSNCCNASVTITSQVPEYITSYLCSKCNNPCDVSLTGTPNMSDVELKEKIIHALGLCRYKCDGNPHIPATTEEDIAEVEQIMTLIEQRDALRDKEYQSMIESTVNLRDNIQKEKRDWLSRGVPEYSMAVKDMVDSLMIDYARAMLNGLKEKDK